MNLSIPTSLLPELLHRRQQLNAVRGSLPDGGQVRIDKIPSRKKNSTPPPNIVEVELPPSGPATLNDFAQVTSAKDLTRFSVPELRSFCSQHKLSKTGRRSNLVQRVLDYILTQKKKQQRATKKQDIVELSEDDIRELTDDGGSWSPTLTDDSGSDQDSS